MAYKRDTEPLEGYPTGGLAPQPGTVGLVSTTPTYSSPKASSTTTSIKHPTVSQPAPSSTNTASDFIFIELHDGKNVDYLPEEHFLAADFESICPSQNCQTDCRNLTRVFTVHADHLLDNPDGKVADVPVTLFGICSNLANATNSASLSGDSRVQSFFPTALTELETDIELISSNLTACLSTTCEMTRKPSECVDHCRPGNLLQSPSLFNFSPGIYQCTYNICSNTCGLPYANQDVFGIGVLISSYIQAVLLFLLAAASLISAALQIWRLRRKPTIPRHKKLFENVLENFLATQCYFGATVAIASFFMNPGDVDPLNGYALLAVALMGCISPVFTLLLLHSHGVKSWSGTGLCSISWILNTIVFFMLVQNLTGSLENTMAVEGVLRSLLETDFCGGSSAMVLCQEWTGSNPLDYLSGFYNQEMFPNIHSIPVIWAYTTLVFLILASFQILHKDATRGRPPIRGFAPLVKTSLLQRFGRIIRSLEFQFILLSLAVAIFSLTLRYQYTMVKTYERMGVVDKGSWPFGQVVAVLFWAPALLEAAKSYIGMD
ncbi:hypothetical protein VM1G_11703 [Cytospora mali]|uniref:Uncharacterized protein n=1 Tax=Cytospora mali TaxID=578113 RepID=A0A194W1R5_CYTMA|nr:hypothetical protein VM1G_11703 [Valsa mali]